MKNFFFLYPANIVFNWALISQRIWAFNPYEICNKKYLTKDLKKNIFFPKSTEYLKINKTFKSYLFLYSICFHSYTHLSNFRYDLISMVNKYQNLWISNFYAENKTFDSLLTKNFFMYAIGLGDEGKALTSGIDRRSQFSS